MIDAIEIKQLGHKFGIDEIRITSATPLRQPLNKIKEQIDLGLFLGTEHWQKKDTTDFCNPRSKLACAQSIIVACEGYLTAENEDITERGNPYGRIARYTWRNHYRDLRTRLRKVALVLQKKYDAKFCVYSNGPLAEKPLAQRSGLGYYGKHSVIINNKYGSWIVLGEIVTDLEIESDNPLEQKCGECRTCIEACPTNAIIEPYIIDRRRCIQALTNWENMINDDIMDVWENRLYGCTTCQEVCPVNKNIKTRSPRTRIGEIGPCIPLLDILSMDELEYRKHFRKNQMGEQWVKFRAIKRNALIALGNINDDSTRPILEKYATHEDSLFARTAQWALAKM